LYRNSYLKKRSCPLVCKSTGHWRGSRSIWQLLDKLLPKSLQSPIEWPKTGQVSTLENFQESSTAAHSVVVWPSSKNWVQPCVGSIFCSVGFQSDPHTRPSASGDRVIWWRRNPGRIARKPIIIFESLMQQKLKVWRRLKNYCHIQSSWHWDQIQTRLTRTQKMYPVRNGKVKRILVLRKCTFLRPSVRSDSVFRHCSKLLRKATKSNSLTRNRAPGFGSTSPWVGLQMCLVETNNNNSFMGLWQQTWIFAAWHHWQIQLTTCRLQAQRWRVPKMATCQTIIRRLKLVDT